MRGRWAIPAEGPEREALYRRCYALARETAARILRGTGSREDAEECAADALAELFARPQRYDAARASLEAYVRVLSRSRALDCRRRLLARPQLPLQEEICPAPAPSEGQKELLRELVASLGPQERALFTLKYLYGYNTREIARRLHISDSAVTTRGSRLKKKLAALVEQLEGEGER
ncbi:sigma-70 family RNA polymerase sigma factor [Bittarella massiliensis]|uniref:sigma-70 family RNA polymerase sigma factor n=1 Tax=Bittarella massiliensis (ex Durand et al. 2017) TaxID=1720313 RepID=UPI00163D35B9|nr:sigma-70 family RNA polymerase sigma factor [Bittarella massiliensis (ex Durand et al. 2017)]MBC2872167.1 sigma-70 family RNA polymerase sigma factor [Bittarella massiliensis (ex Durand et al. 2017)]